MDKLSEEISRLFESTSFFKDITIISFKILTIAMTHTRACAAKATLEIASRHGHSNGTNNYNPCDLTLSTQLLKFLASPYPKPVALRG
ncbi:hypothetical protein ISG08_21285 [Burkholderia pseudomallei]|nr:hypothetical protein X945_5766 [Burkholderia pseudomallei ABCPW 107]MBF3805561.1 hypothetical protein [Burkholderia pseudomallei]